MSVSILMGIRIHTGSVMVGNIGSLRRTKYAAVGSNVNLTGRLESDTTGGQVLITEATRARIGAALRIDGQFRVEPKGTAQPRLVTDRRHRCPLLAVAPVPVDSGQRAPRAAARPVHGAGGEARVRVTSATPELRAWMTSWSSS